MDKIIEMLKDRQGTQSLNSFASELGMWPSSLSRYYTGQRAIGQRGLQHLLREFTQRGDFDAVSTLITYALGGVFDEGADNA